MASLMGRSGETREDVAHPPGPDTADSYCSVDATRPLDKDEDVDKSQQLEVHPSGDLSGKDPTFGSLRDLSHATVSDVEQDGDEDSGCAEATVEARPDPGNSGCVSRSYPDTALNDTLNLQVMDTESEEGPSRSYLLLQHLMKVLPVVRGLPNETFKLLEIDNCYCYPELRQEMCG